MKLADKYKIRVNDISEFFEILAFIDNVETYKGKPLLDTNNKTNSLLLTREAQQCMRAEVFLLLYNVIESTINECLQLVRDAIEDDKLTYFELDKNIRKLWVDSRFSSAFEKIDKVRKLSFDIAENICTKQLLIDKMPNTSGNLDMRKIVNLSNKIGINLNPIPNHDNSARILLSIKEKRNDLAHGNKSFSSVGKLVTYSELTEYKDVVLTFLHHVIAAFQNFIDNKMYRCRI